MVIYRCTFLLILLCANFLYSQGSMVFGVKQGPDNSSAYLGIRHGNFVPFVGADLHWLTANGGFETTTDDYDYMGNTTFRRLSFVSVDLDAKALLIVPSIGAKYFITSKLARPYVFGSVFLSLPSVKLETDGYEEQWSYTNDEFTGYTKQKASPNLGSVEQTINDLLSYWGFRFGAGAEYFFDPHFSVGAEYGIHVLFNQADHEDVNQAFNSTYPSDKFQNNWQVDLSVSQKLSYALFSLNYYF